MGAYEYQALDDRGHRRRGVLAGDTARQVRQQLRDKGLSPLSVDPVREGRSGGWSGRSLGTTEQALLLRQLASLLSAGLPLEEALGTVAEQSDKAQAQRIFVALRSRVMEGHSLSAAMAEFPRAFPPLVGATVAAGEQSGRLDQVLERLADYAESREALGRKVMLALLYPAIVALVAIATVLGLMAYVVPQVISVFASMDQALPALTRGLISTSAFLTEHGRWIALALLLVAVLFAVGLRSTALRRQWHALLLQMPIVGRLNRALNTARFTRTLSILTVSAVPLLEALTIAAGVLGNLAMRAAAETVARRVREGASLHRALAQTGRFPPLVVRLVASGEKSGQLEQMLERAAVNQDREVESTITVIMGILEPALILLVGGLVLTIVLAILLPIFQMNQLIG